MLDIILYEVGQAIKNIASRKALGPDIAVAEILKKALIIDDTDEEV